MAEAVLEKTSNEQSFEELLNQSIVYIYTGDVVEGTVIDITPTEIIVDLGFKTDGVIEESEISYNPAIKPSDVAKIGEKISAFVIRVQDGDFGRVQLSLKKLESIENAKKIREAAGTDAVFNGKVTRVIDGGLIVFSGDTKIFVPASQSGVSRGEDLNKLLNKAVPVRIIEVDERRRRVVGSIRQAQNAGNAKAAQEFWSNIFVGQEINGKVKNFTTFGVFVDLGGVDGLVHLSEISWEKNKKPEDVFEIGQEVQVTVKDFDAERQKVSLGYRKASDNPWNKYAGQISEGDVIKVKIARIAPFGAFAEIFPGVDGLIHVSEIDVVRVDNISSKLKIGQEVEVKVLNIDDAAGKISLSIAALLDGYIIKENPSAQEGE